MRELVLGKQVIAFDGRAVEVFHEGVSNSVRIHVTHLSVHARGPDRKGRYDVTLAPSPEPHSGVKLEVPEERMPELRELVETMKRAR